MLGLSSACASASQRLAEQLAPPVVMPPATNKVPTALLWLRRDLRVADNPALVAALQGAFQVVRHHLLACAATPCVVLAASVLDRPPVSKTRLPAPVEPPQPGHKRAPARI